MPTPAKSLAEHPATMADPVPEVPLAVAAGVHEADRAGVTVPVELLELGQIVERQVDRRSCDRGSRVKSATSSRALGCSPYAFGQGAGEQRAEMAHVAQLSDRRGVGYLEESDHRRQGGGDRFDHDPVLGALLRRGEQGRRGGAVRPRSPLRAAVPARGSESDTGRRGGG